MMRRACDMTRKAGLPKSTITREKLLQCEHAPVRLIRFFIEIIGLPTKASVHLVRHKIGVEHFVESNRIDKCGGNDEQINRLTPVNHGMEINAQALIQISRRRLCYNAEKTTVAIWRAVKKEMGNVCAETAQAMVPECVYRNGFCPELKQCKPGLSSVLKMYGWDSVDIDAILKIKGRKK